MERTHIKRSINKIQRSKVDGYHLEALLNKYILVVELINFITLKLVPSRRSIAIKPKANIKLILRQISESESARTVASRKNLKSAKLWLAKMDAYIKTLRFRRPKETVALLNEGEKVLTLLNISAEKLMNGKSGRARSIKTRSRT